MIFLEIVWGFIKYSALITLGTLTMPFWGPWYLIEYLCEDWCDKKSEKVKLILQIVITSIVSLLFIGGVVISIMDGERQHVTDDKYDREFYYSRKYEPGW